MIKGVLIEKKKNYAIVLTEDGDFQKTVPAGGLEIGEEAILHPLPEQKAVKAKSRNPFNRLSVRVSTALALILLLILPFYTWMGTSNEASAYVSIDINPSIELTVNDDKEVIDATGFNEEGVALINDLSWQDQSVINVSEAIFKKSDELGYLKEDREVLLGVSYLTDKEESDLLEQISDKIHHYDENVKVAMFTIPDYVRQQASEMNQSMNVTYATETLTTYYEEQEKSDEDQSEASTESDVSRQENSVEENGTDEKAEKIELLKRFMKRSNADQLPPGLLKKIQEDQSLPPGLQKKQEDEESPTPDSSDGSEMEEEGEANQGRHPSDKGKDHPSHKDEDHPSNKGENHPSNKGANHPSNKDNDHPSNKGNDHPSNKKSENAPDKRGNDRGNSTKGEGHPSEKGDDHPSKSKGNGPPDRSGDHPSDKDEDHPSNNRGNGQSDQQDGQPSENGKNHPSNRGNDSDDS